MKHFFLICVFGVTSNFCEAQFNPVLLKDIYPGDTSCMGPNVYASTLPLGNLLYFKANDGTHGIELWKTDGTIDGTVLVKDINPSTTTHGVAELLYGHDGYLYFTGKELYTELWRSEGTENGTEVFSDVCMANFSLPSEDLHATDFLHINGLLYFRERSAIPSYDDLWVSDGTPDGTQLIKTFQTFQPPFTSFALTNFNDKIYFRARDINDGVEPWISDGTEAGTVKLKDIYVGAETSSPSDFRVVENKLFFHATTPEYGREMWVSDGTEAGTILIMDINSGVGDGIYFDDWMRDLYVTPDGKLLFIANNGTNGYELWVTDGTSGGTNMIMDIRQGNGDSEIAFLNTEGSKAFFRATTATTGNELWITDGTVAGTYMVKDINPTASSITSNSVPHTLHNDLLYFTANEGINGSELWVSDGTEEGTHLVYDILPGLPGSAPTEIFSLGEKLVFFATTPATGRELWSLDLTVSANEPALNWEMELYPTVSTTGHFTVHINDETHKIYLCEVFDALGRIQQSRMLSPGAQSLILQDLPVGMYFLRFTKEGDGINNQVVKKVMIGQ